MSGGSYNYTYSRVDEEYVGKMYDKELDDLMKDLIPVLHDLEWWQSADYREEHYRETVKKFKDKWFKQNRTERLKHYIDNELEKIKEGFYEMLGSD